MDYRELLKKCTSQPGCLGTKEQKEIEARIKYEAWVIKKDEEYFKEKGKE